MSVTYSISSQDELKSIRSHQLLMARCQNGYISGDKMQRLEALGVTVDELQKVQDCSFKRIGGGPGNSKPVSESKSVERLFTSEPIAPNYTGHALVQFKPSSEVLECENGFVTEYSRNELFGWIKYTFQEKDAYGPCYVKLYGDKSRYYYEYSYLVSSIKINEKGTGLIYSWST